MSYDLMVFEPDVAPDPSDRVGFMTWYAKQTEWAEPHGYNDPQITSMRLRAWYEDMNVEYPNMNGEGINDDYDSPKLTDYSIGTSVIYSAFAWSQAEDAYTVVRRFAEKHRVGFFDVSADEGEIWLPPAAYQKSKPGFWKKLLGR